MVLTKQLQDVLTRQKQKWEEICEDLKRFEEDPLILITKVFKGGDLFLAERLKQEGEQKLIDAHDYWIQHLLPSLNEYFSEDGVELKVEEGLALSHIYIEYEGELVAHFSPYWRTFVSYGVPGKESLMTERHKIEEELKILEEEREAKYLLYENPSILAEDDIVGYTKAILRPKKFKEDMRVSIEEVHERIGVAQRKLVSITNELEYKEMQYRIVDDCLEKIKRKVSRWNDFVFIDASKEELE